MMLSCISIRNLVFVLELFLERSSSRLRKCRHATLYILLKELGHKSKRPKTIQSVYTHLFTIVKREREEES